MKFEQFITKAKLSIFKVRALLLVFIAIALMNTKSGTLAQEIPPVLEFPQVGLDDISTYRGYITRFFQDSEGNTIQIYINQNTGRIVNIWADAANESISFTVRDTSGQPVELTWLSEGAEVSSRGRLRFVQYTLTSESTSLDIGLFLLGSMRKERDYQYFQRHLQPFGAEPLIENELNELIGHIEGLPDKDRSRHLTILKVKNTNKLRSRLVPQVTSSKSESRSIVLVGQPTFDGKNYLSLELGVDNSKAAIDVAKDKISIRSLLNQPIQLAIKVATDSPSLIPLQRDDIFNNDFFRFYERVKTEYDSLLHRYGEVEKNITANERRLHFKRLERQVKSLELLSSQEKLMAGIPNFATYFGRDMMVSALMLEPIWNPVMLEHVIASVLRKLSPSGEVSHEEGLGSQAIRENAAKYNKLISEYFQQKAQNDDHTANKILANAEELLANLQAVTENYHMVDDDFQLPVLAARYLTRSDIPADRKRAFLQANSGKEDGTSRVTLLMRNLLYVSQISRSYVTQPVAENFVSFRKLDEQRWHSGSWRDSGAGYANGRYAMDINVVWVPQALEAIEKIFAILHEIDISFEDIENIAPEIRDTKLADYAHNPEALQQAINTWRDAIRHFEVRLSVQEVHKKVHAKLDWLSGQERTYWENIFAKSAVEQDGIEFLALSLDENGQPIPVVNTDLATWLFLEDLTDKILEDKVKPEEVIKRLRIFVVPYPVGLFFEGVGPAVANDVYASSGVWENFQRDIYHSPQVVWGREVNLLFLGLAKQILAAYDSEGRIKDAILDSYVQELRAILNKTLTAVESSGLKHNELWSYRIVNKNLLPARYPTTSDIQLWNLADLAVQYLLERISSL